MTGDDPHHLGPWGCCTACTRQYRPVQASGTCYDCLTPSERLAYGIAMARPKQPVSKRPAKRKQAGNALLSKG